MPDAVLQGSLASFKLPEVLTFLHTTRKTGTLTIASGGKASYVFFREGALIYAGSNQEQFRLGDVLLRKKKITRTQRDAIDSLMRQEGGRFGQFAVQQGILTDAQLLDFLKIQVSEIVYDCFVWEGGSFSFVDAMELPIYAVTISVDLANLIMEGARRIEEWEQCLRLMPDKEAVFRVVSRPSEEKVTLTADEWNILFLINGRRTLQELCQDAEEEPFHVYRVIYGLFASKLIEPAPPEEEERDDTGDATTIRTPDGPRTSSGEETVRQGPAQFGGDSTVRETPDDTSLLVSSEAVLSYRDVVRPTIAQLAFLSGDNQGTTLPLSEAEYLMGRHRDNQIQIPDLGVSGFHARIYMGPSGYVIEDLRSRNGVWVNSVRITTSPLMQGDRLRIGATEIEYQVLFEQ
jgi:hypothetical protein